MRSKYRASRFEGGGSILLAIGVVFLAAVILGTVGLAIYGGGLSASQKPVEQEIPDARFPR